MADIFISYAKDDRAAAQRVASWLEADGLSAWWDTSLLAGDSWSDVIRAELRDARCVVVLWSKLSWASRWVQAEAHSGFERDCLVSVILDDIALEAPFNTIQAVRLDAGRANLLAGVRKKLGQAAIGPVGRPIGRKRAWLSRRAMLGVGGGALAVGALGAGAFVARPHIPRWFPYAAVTDAGRANGLRGLRVLKTLRALPALRMHFALNETRLYSTSTNEAQLWDVSTGGLVAHWPLGSIHQGDTPPPFA